MLYDLLSMVALKGKNTMKWPDVFTANKTPNPFKDYIGSKYFLGERKV